jgi:hypothetical protein
MLRFEVFFGGGGLLFVFGNYDCTMDWRGIVILLLEKHFMAYSIIEI